MKLYGLLGAFIGFVVAVLVFTQIPAVAQQTSADEAWEIYASAFGSHSYFVVKHNRVTGETLVLNCGKDKTLSSTQGCFDDSEWMRLPTVVVE